MTSDVRHITRRAFTVVCAVLASGSLGAQAPRLLVLPKVAPTVDQILSLGRVGSPEISPDGRWVAYTATEPKSTALKDREKKYGEFQVIDDEHRMTHLFLLDIAAKTARQLTSGAFTVGSFDWSPDGLAIAFVHRTDPTPASSG